MVYQGRLRLGRKLAGLVVQVSGGVPDAQKERRPASQDQSNLREKGSTQFFEQGSPPCSFFCAVRQALALESLIPRILKLAAERRRSRARSGRTVHRLFPRRLRQDYS